jgi:hypothetical protein
MSAGLQSFTWLTKMRDMNPSSGCVAALAVTLWPAFKAPPSSGPPAAKITDARRAKDPARELEPVPRPELCVTEGTISETSSHRLSIEAPAVRGVLKHLTAERVEARFTYLGPTAKTRELRSGEVRHQFGLKLNAQDGCNLVYVMWRFGEPSKLVVSTKLNPGMHRSSECTNHGYRNIRPSAESGLPSVEPESSHALSAEIEGRELAVRADGQQVWKGVLPEDALALRGPVGIRSDNVRLDFELLAPRLPEDGPEAGCEKRAGDTD